MSWVCELSADAEKDLEDLPRAIQKRVARVMTQMAIDPFQGNVIALQGDDWKGVFRRRIGDYRLLFKAVHEKNSVIVVRILLRSGKTYR
jgi:mRNA-degrading endonuclease RelE of RelBE toxin-antitoxin system